MADPIVSVEFLGGEKDGSGFKALKEKVEGKLREHEVEIRWTSEYSGQKYYYNTPVISAKTFPEKLPIWRKPEEIVDEMMKGASAGETYIATVHEYMLYYTPIKE